ncbi:drug/metabolite transporter (DMT)-like permease [Oceanisphaera litoralis]|uniref:DMT family transporter n=1 Tax=Oceanisphaera litoralis TaxID=225144 RepID=UPI00195C1E2D|nr:DMT family transporter [Oceanisphaera litoralis]MBM7456095.1 drug/metabolite transporter (DMT)-like permease [Oceanisphaera litoralis]
MSFSYDYLALAAATCWALASLLSANAARHLGAFAFSRWRMFCVSLMLWSVALLTGGWSSLSSHGLSIMAISGLIGIFIGDTALFAAMNRLGPRRAGVLFATHALFSVLLAYLVFGEVIAGLTLVGCFLLVGAVMTAIFMGKRSNETHAWEQDNGSPGPGIALGLVSALCQSVATLMVKPVMTSDTDPIDPVSASAVRMSAAFLAHLVLLWCGLSVAKPLRRINWSIFAMVALNAFLAMGVGMTLILLALRHGEVGMVAMLSSVSPVLVLPLLWLFMKRRPANGAWLGALATVIGALLIVGRH